MQELLSNDDPGAGEGPPEPRRPRSDRRAGPTPRLSLHSLAGGRRRGPRREAEVEGSYVDLYGSRFLLALLWVALMNAGDSFFTLVHLQSGGTEVNPVAGLFLQTGRLGFVAIKSAVIGMALVVLCLHKNFQLARAGMWAAAIAYTALNAYHLLLFVL